jgi:hypothetical protein
MGGKKRVQILNKHAYNSRLTIGGISLSLLGVLCLAANRIVRVLKGRKDICMSRNAYQSRSMICASTGDATARGVEAVRAKKKVDPCPPSDHEEEVPFVSPVKRAFMVTASVIVGGRIVQPPIDEDDIVYFDE